MNPTNLVALVGVAALAATAGADILITQQGSSAPTYDTTLDFDEDGGPTGIIEPDAFASIGLAELQAGDSVPQVDDWDPIFGGWGLGDGNSFFGNFGVFMTFDSDLTAFSVQIWDPSGPPTFMGGGLNIFLFNDGVQVWDLFAQNGDIATPAWGGVGDSWFDITTTDGMVFDEVRILGFGFSPTTFADNLSWNAVPSPGGLALIAMAGLAGRGRRRR